jgi:hypothetical protein
MSKKLCCWTSSSQQSWLYLFTNTRVASYGRVGERLEIMVLMRIKLSFHGCFLFLLLCTYVERVVVLAWKAKRRYEAVGVMRMRRLVWVWEIKWVNKN